jgi:hypothetical protein
MSPLMVVGPVLVMPAPARTAKFSAPPRGTTDGAARATSPMPSVSPTESTAARAVVDAARRDGRRRAGAREIADDIAVSGVTPALPSPTHGVGLGVR